MTDHLDHSPSRALSFLSVIAVYKWALLRHSVPLPGAASLRFSIDYCPLGSIVAAGTFSSVDCVGNQRGCYRRWERKKEASSFWIMSFRNVYTAAATQPYAPAHTNITSTVRSGLS